MKILITGANGMLGEDIQEGFKNEDLLCFDTNLRCYQQRHSTKKVKEINPDVLIHCAAFTQVDKCEEEADLALKVNGEALEYVAEACAQNDITLIHFSTDYIFSGDK